MRMNLIDDYFQLLQLPETFELDTQLLSDNYLDLQRQFHPDRFADKSSQEQRLAVQKASAVNQACDTLRSPLRRAAYLLERRGFAVAGDKTLKDMSFLLEQMALRERLSALPLEETSFAELAKIGTEVSANLNALEQCFAQQYQDQAFEPAVDTVMKMQFYAKLQVEIEDLEESIEGF